MTCYSYYITENIGIVRNIFEEVRRMTQQEKIEFILKVTPKLSKIIKFATDEQIDRLFEEAQKKRE